MNRHRRPGTSEDSSADSLEDKSARDAREDHNEIDILATSTESKCTKSMRSTARARERESERERERGNESERYRERERDIYIYTYIYIYIYMTPGCT